jgi:antitoxin component YwqK of YwqJK toxin-antitoxin module
MMATSNISLNFNGQFNKIINDLNTPLEEGKSVVTFNIYSTSASNKPTGNFGFCITNGSGSYRQQIAFELEGGIYTRYYANGTISSWVKRST